MVASADEQVAEQFRKNGWQVLTKGWPDLLVYKPPKYPASTGQFMAIELKRGKDSMSPEQKAMSFVFKEMLRLPFYVCRDEDIKSMMRKKGARFPMPGTSMKDQLAKIEEMENKIRWLHYELEDRKAELENIAPLWKPLDLDDDVCNNPEADHMLERHKTFEDGGPIFDEEFIRHLNEDYADPVHKERLLAESFAQLMKEEKG
jgi:hypothetical protein